MKWLRYLLLVSSVGILLFVLFAMQVEASRMLSSEIALAFAIVTALTLNIVYLAAVRPAGGRESRALRIFRLWLDAKENELRRRAGSDR